MKSNKYFLILYTRDYLNFTNWVVENKPGYIFQDDKGNIGFSFVKIANMRVHENRAVAFMAVAKTALDDYIDEETGKRVIGWIRELPAEVLAFSETDDSPYNYLDRLGAQKIRSTFPEWEGEKKIKFGEYIN